jgi:hypothetical protein
MKLLFPLLLLANTALAQINIPFPDSSSLPPIPDVPGTIIEGRTKVTLYDDNTQFLEVKMLFEQGDDILADLTKGLILYFMDAPATTDTLETVGVVEPCWYLPVPEGVIMQIQNNVWSARQEFGQLYLVHDGVVKADASGHVTSVKVRASLQQSDKQKPSWEIAWKIGFKEFEDVRTLVAAKEVGVYMSGNGIGGDLATIREMKSNLDD